MQAEKDYLHVSKPMSHERRRPSVFLLYSDPRALQCEYDELLERYHSHPDVRSLVARHDSARMCGCVEPSGLVFLSLGLSLPITVARNGAQTGPSNLGA